ncbi:MAG: hypothetical protein ACOX2G_12495 [Bacillota bacterium]
MNKDHGLEQLLRSMGQIGIERPDGLLSRTTQRMRSVLPEKRRRQAGKIGKNVRLVVATTFLLLLGYTFTWAALPLLSRQSAIGENINLSEDSRIIAAAEQLDYALALPTHVPSGYSLAEVKVDGQRLTLIFTGPPGEPITMVQSPHLDQFFPRDTVFIDFSARGDADKPLARGFSFRSRHQDGAPGDRTVVFRHGQSYITLHSAAPASIPGTSLDPLVSVAMGIIGADQADQAIPQNQYVLAKDWGAVPLPEGGLEYQGVQLVSHYDERIYVELVFRFADYLYTVRFSDPRSLAPTEGALQVDIDGSIGYLWEENSERRLLFTIDTANVEIAGPQGEGALVQEDFFRYARWIVNSQFITAMKITDLQPTTDCRKSFIDLAAGDIPLLKVGEIIELDFAGDPPDSVQVLDHFLTDSGEIPYDDRTIIEREVEFHGDMVRLPVEFHFASVLSSQYPAPPSLRGFRIICTWDAATREYALVIKTDE